MLKKVETIRTSVSGKELVLGFINGWLKAFNEIPSKEAIGVLFAQNSLETGGTKYMWNFNIGNVKAVDKPGEIIEYCALKGVWEIINGKRIEVPETNPSAWFRSFKTLSDGVAHHFAFLKNNRYKKSWVAVEEGNPAEFSRLLRSAGYYTAPEKDYTRLIKFYFNKYMKSSMYEDALNELKPTLNILNNEVSVDGELDLAHKSSTWSKLTGMFAKAFKK